MTTQTNTYTPTHTHTHTLTHTRTNHTHTQAHTHNHPIATDRLFSNVNEGDLLAVMDTGAYGYSMSHNFNTRPRAAEVLVSKKDFTLIRKRETLEDIFSNCNV